MKHILGAVAVIAAVATATQADAACGKVTIADMNWKSAALMANVDKFILQHGYGCDAELVPGDTMPTGTSMIEKGEPDIAPELWSNSFASQLKRGVADGRLKVAGASLSDGGEEGFWMPQYMVDKEPSLATISGIKANAKLFKHPEDPNKSAFYSCPAGWGCQITNGNLFVAMKLADAGFEIVDPGSAAGLAGSIAKAYERKEPWFGYYWAPTPILGKYPMVKVDFEAKDDPAYFKDCLAQAECENPKTTMWPPSPVVTVTVTGFAAKSPEAFAYLGKRAFTNVKMNTLLAWMEDEQADGDVAAEHFLKSDPDTWKAWVPADVAAKIRKALDNL
ncbi:ABC transporter substrate-binding protein [Magnetospira sp. QH-2]|uniref:ABC transporter substrate-binding protein n=1 Tax=Magnetospira sp. (strain QH-2) TaxID=1288970 RepID=UPI0003E80CB4|nr:ABC transporter substrate-binding protein [Magnetospira sp. QH-2]CCQ73283.1 Putative glycine betaine transporter subunit; periplasmic-binding component of ABC superfamily [Magnetospira sp. QH-2]